MTENQKLREALQAASRILESVHRDVLLNDQMPAKGLIDALSLTRQALALPTAAQSATHPYDCACQWCKGKTAAPAGEQEAFTEALSKLPDWAPDYEQHRPWVNALLWLLWQQARAALACDARDAARWRYAMDWGQKDFAVCMRVGKTGVCWEPIKTDGPIDQAMARGGELE